MAMTTIECDGTFQINYDNQQTISASDNVNLGSQANEPSQSLTATLLSPNYLPAKSQEKGSTTKNQETNINLVDC
ncbi:10822_t:CDS:2 [Cetraspora pellucida]|uniref:10822_t:CDS:1 n=1 Tax=Cetraspora pellucida TaxID=1433469 RepID=A0A9N8ZEQ8_9GLOM|nr:10822_t:CDS:2 [Cetraspora pellucida]